jgi:hypothetical protein
MNKNFLGKREYVYVPEREKLLPLVCLDFHDRKA